MPFQTDGPYLNGVSASGQTATDTSGVQIPPKGSVPSQKYMLFLNNATTTGMDILINSGGTPVIPLEPNVGNIQIALGANVFIYVKADSGTPNVNWGTWTG